MLGTSSDPDVAALFIEFEGNLRQIEGSSSEQPMAKAKAKAKGKTHQLAWQPIGRWPHSLRLRHLGRRSSQDQDECRRDDLGPRPGLLSAPEGAEAFAPKGIKTSMDSAP